MTGTKFPSDLLKSLKDQAEDMVEQRMDAVDQAVALLAALVGPLAAAHRCAELAITFKKQADREGDVG